MDFLSQVFVHRDLVARRLLLFLPTALMLLTTGTRPGDNLGWWEGAARAPSVSYFPEVLTPADHVATVQVRSENPLSDLEVSLDSGVNWAPVGYLTGSRVEIGQLGKEAVFTFSLQVGHLAQHLSQNPLAKRKIRSVLLRGVTRQGRKTAPKSLVFIYKKPSAEGLLSKL